MALSRVSVGYHFIVCVMVVVSFCGSCYGVVHKVGENSGWASINNSSKVDYKDWASKKKFYTGDTIVFKYPKKYQNVIQLRHQDYHICNITTPLAVYADGYDLINLTLAGHYYFTSGFPGRCNAGQKVDFRVFDLSLRSNQSNPSTSVSSPPPSTSPTLKSVVVSPDYFSSLGLLGLFAISFWVAYSAY